MPLTRESKQTIIADLQDRDYRAAYLAEAIEAMHGGELSIGKRMLRNYVIGTVGFEALSRASGSPAKSLMRMLSESSNPHSDKLFEILRHLPEADRSEVKVAPMAKRSKRSSRTDEHGAKHITPAGRSVLADLAASPLKRLSNLK